MSFILRWKLKKLGEKANPSRDFVMSLEQRLKQENGHPAWWIQWSRVAAIGASTFVLLASGTGAYAYTSDEVLPNHPLYGLREGIEQVETKLAVSPERKTKIRIKHLQRRLEEARKLQRKNVPIGKDRVIEAARKIRNEIEAVEKLPEKEHQKIEQDAIKLEKTKLKLLEESKAATKSDQDRKQYEEILKREKEALKKKLERVQQRQLREIEKERK